MVPGQFKTYRYGISQKNWQGKKASAPYWKRDSVSISCVFLYGRSDTYENTSRRTDHLQCGSGDQYRCSLYHYAVRWNCPGEESLLIFPVKRPDVPCAGTDPEIPEGTWFCTGRREMGLCKTPEHRTRKEDRRSSHKICRRKPCRCNRVSSIWRQKERYPGKRNRNCICGEKGISRNAVNIRHTERDAGIQDLCMEYQQACI